MCATIGCAITVAECAIRKVQVSLPGGSGGGEIAICSVPDSVATSAIATEIGVVDDPRITSTLSSVTRRRAFFTPVDGSVASSSTIIFTFCPAIVSGHSLKPLLVGMPSPEAGPVSDSTTPTVSSARALNATLAITPAARSFRAVFMSRLPPCCGLVALRGSSDPRQQYFVVCLRVAVQALDQRGAVAQHGALVDRALVGDFVAVDRRWLGHHVRARDPARAAGALAPHPVDQRLEERPHDRMP